MLDADATVTMVLVGGFAHRDATGALVYSYSEAPISAFADRCSQTTGLTADESKSFSGGEK